VLTEDQIIDAAMVIARDQGIARLSMRAVARQLDVAPMTIYGYVPNKDALDTMVIDRILSEVRIPDPDEGPWEARLCLMLCDARRILVERPHLGDGQPVLGGSAVELLHRGAFGGEATRLANGVFDLIAQGGFASEDLGVCFGALFTYVTGYVDPASTPDAFAAGLEALIAGLKQTMGPPHID
jgi:AcrR family transcriptional regulator